MLAPRKTLWSTPLEVVDVALDLLALGPEVRRSRESFPLCLPRPPALRPSRLRPREPFLHLIFLQDTLLDVGCGDARVLRRAVERFGCRGVGVEIDEPRAAAASEAVAAAGLADRITIRCGNALDDELPACTAVFLYLIERGLRRIVPLLQRAAGALPPAAHAVGDGAGRGGGEGGSRVGSLGASEATLEGPSGAARGSESTPPDSAAPALPSVTPPRAPPLDEASGSALGIVESATLPSSASSSSCASSSSSGSAASAPSAPRIRVVTAMYRVPAEIGVAPASVTPALDHAGVRWPLHLYLLGP